MLVTEYLDKKYEFKSTTMTSTEARIFGIPYPLVSGWREKFGAIEIDATMRFRLVQSLSASKKHFAPAGLIALGEQAVSVSGYLSKQADRLTKKKAKKAAKAARFLIDHPPGLPSKAKKVSRKYISTQHSFVVTDAFLQSYEWRVARMKALTKYGPVCQCCGASPSTGAVMNVDHIKPRRIFPQLALDVDNLQILCHECNHGKGNWDMTDWRPDDIDRQIAKGMNF